MGGGERPQDAHKIGNLEEERQFNLLALRKAPRCTQDGKPRRDKAFEFAC